MKTQKNLQMLLPKKYQTRNNNGGIDIIAKISIVSTVNPKS